MGKIRHKIVLNQLSFRTILRLIQQMQYLQPKPNRCQFSQNHNKLKVIIKYMPYRVIQLDSYANKHKKSFTIGKNYYPCFCVKRFLHLRKIFTLAGGHFYTCRNYYTCGKTLLHLRLIIVNFQIITLVGLTYPRPQGA